MMMEERKLNVSCAVVMATEPRVISITCTAHNKVVSPANQNLSRGNPRKFTSGPSDASFLDKIDGIYSDAAVKYGNHCCYYYYSPFCKKLC